jgi:pre-mRNA-splicing helicase BRR2
VAKKQLTKRRAETSAAAAGATYGFSDIIEATQDVEGLTYRPRTAEMWEVYQFILSAVLLGDQSPDIVRSAADPVLETLKNEDLKDFIEKHEIEDAVGSVTRHVQPVGQSRENHGLWG